MAFWVIMLVAVAGSVAWFVRTPLFRAHLRRHGTPDEVGERAGGIQYNDWQDPRPLD